MSGIAAVDAIQRLKFGALFSADWMIGPKHVEKVMPRRWDDLHHRLLDRVTRDEPGRTFEVPRVANMTPEQFRDEYFLTGKPVVLEGAAAEWPAIRKWSPEYLLQRCGQDEIAVLDAHHWHVNADGEKEAVSTSERMSSIAELLENIKRGADGTARSSSCSTSTPTCARTSTSGSSSATGRRAPCCRGIPTSSRRCTWVDRTLPRRCTARG